MNVPTADELDELAELVLTDDTSAGLTARARLDARYGFSSPHTARTYAALLRSAESQGTCENYDLGFLCTEFADRSEWCLRCQALALHQQEEA